MNLSTSMNLTTPVTKDFRSFLQSELVRRCQANPRYSLRAFARVIGVESSALSKILAGKRSISRQMFQRISRKLAISPKDHQLFEKQLHETRGRPGGVFGPSHSVSTDYQTLALDHFHIVSEWYHFAILELVSIQGFQPDVRWIARNLGISVVEVRAAVERLERLDLLEITENGQWIDRAANLTTIATDFTDAAQRKLQARILSMAIAALEEVPLAARDNTGMTMAIDSRRLPEAKRRIGVFRRELCTYLQAGKKDAVYQLGIALFPLTKNQNK